MRRSMLVTACSLALVIAPSAAADGGTTVAQFLARVAALKAQGIAAMMSPEVGRLRREMKVVTDAYRADVQAARAAGRGFSSCPPPRGRASMTSDELIAEFERFPAAERSRMSVKDGFYRVMARRYPCPAR